MDTVCIDKRSGIPEKRNHVYDDGTLFFCWCMHWLRIRLYIWGIWCFYRICTTDCGTPVYVHWKDTGREWYTGRNGRRNNEGRDFSRGPRPVSLPGFRRLFWSVLLLVFLCLSVLSRAAPELSLSTRPQRYRLSGVSDKAIRSALVGRPCLRPGQSFRWSLTERKGRNVENCPQPIIEGW